MYPLWLRHSLFGPSRNRLLNNTCPPTRVVHHIPLTEYQLTRTSYRTNRTEIDTLSDCFQNIFDLFSHRFHSASKSFSSSSASLTFMCSFFPQQGPPTEPTEPIEPKGYRLKCTKAALQLIEIPSTLDTWYFLHFKPLMAVSLSLKQGFVQACDQYLEVAQSQK